MPRTIDTRRLHLRPPVPADAPAVFVYASDPCATRYMLWPAAETLDDTHDFLDDVAAGWADGDDFCYLVTRRGTSEVLGAVSCQFSAHGAEIGYILMPSVWGHGLATEAAAALVEHARAVDDVYRIWATCDTENRGSIGVLERLGMRCEGRLRRWAPCPNLPGWDGVPRDAFCYAFTPDRPGAGTDGGAARK